MKNFISIVICILIFTSCKKDGSINPQEELPVAEVFNSKWTFNGTKYVGGNPSWGVPCGSSLFMFAQGKANDTTVFCDLIIPGYLRTGKFQLYTNSPSFGEGVILSMAKQIGNTVIERHISTYGLNDSISLKDEGEFYTAVCNNVTLLENYDPNKRKLFSCEIKFKKPVIPTENANYTATTPIPQSSIFVDNVLRLGSLCNSFTIVNYGGFFKSSYVSSYGGLTFHFSDAFPPSGKYDIISDLNLKPGKVFIQYTDPSPIASYNCVAGGKATVITTQNKFTINFDNTTFNNIGSTGNPSIVVKANVGFY
jgi:hypothetical protein